ncbi:hypothetical protein GUJ93_ZPchr0008g13585 [Zizania palustris]|uniref:Uncharacterized protein n=1 Tax=Zizania palustris TaxID=103762 RepID=A0A8J5QYS5_ZIZPA|nr:hypothetical protein GUJ93_ZPchr0008g13585 [Zizania palustris]
MKRTFLALLFLLTLASQGTWCKAVRRHKINGAQLRPHLQVEELHVTEGKKLSEIQIPRKLGLAVADGHTDKLPMRMAIAHRSGTGGTGGGGASVGGRNVNGGAADTRPHTGKNSAPALPAPATTSILALAFTCATVLSAFSF